MPRLAQGPAPSVVEGTGPAAETRTSGVGKFIRVFLFAAGLLMVGLVAVPLWMLLVGAGCGYCTAVLCEFTPKVYAVDLRADVL